MFIASSVISYSEAAFVLYGRDTDGTVTHLYEITSRRGGTQLKVEYSFTEPNGIKREGTDFVSQGWAVPADRRVAVRYATGARGSSRLAGHPNRLAVVMFFISGAVLLAFFVRLMVLAIRESRDLEPKRRRHRRTRNG